MASKHEAVVTQATPGLSPWRWQGDARFDALGKEDEHAFCASVDRALACWKHTSEGSQIDFFHLDEIKSADVEEEEEADPEQGGRRPRDEAEEETRVANAHVPFDLPVADRWRSKRLDDRQEGGQAFDRRRLLL